MNLQLERDTLKPQHEECLSLHHYRVWFLVLGITVMAAGAAAIASAFAATLTTVLVFGALLIAGGAVQLVNAFLARSWRGFFVYALVGVMHLLVGGIMVEKPFRAAAALTLVLAVTFLAGGLARLIYGALNRFPGRGWVLLNGAVTLLLGLMIWQDWPESSVWVIGLFVGIDLFFSGWSWVMLGLALRASEPREAAAPAALAPA